MMTDNPSLRSHATVSLVLMLVLSLTLIAMPTHAILSDGLLAYWDFDTASNTSHANRVNASTFQMNVSGVPGTFASKYGLGVALQATGQSRLYTGNGIATFPDLSTTNFWFNRQETSAAGDRIWMAKMASNNEVMLRRSTNTEIWYYDGSTKTGTLDAALMPTGMWIMVSVIRRGGNYSVYVNGTFAASLAGANQTSTYIMGLGRASDTTAETLGGYADEYGFWNRILSPAELTQLYNNGSGLNYSQTAQTDSPPTIVAAFPTNQTNYTLVNQTIELRVNATDDFGISTVRANVTTPSGSTAEYALSSTALAGIFNTTLDLTQEGKYVIRFIVNDTANNVVSASTQVFHDSIVPSVIRDSPFMDQVFRDPGVILIAVNVTDANGIRSVNVSIRAPNGTVERSAMTLLSGSTYNTTYNLSDGEGEYFANFTAVDTFGNVNGSVQTEFYFDAHQDSPTVVATHPQNDALYTAPQTVVFLWSANDSTGINTTFIHLYLPNGTQENLTTENLTLTNVSGSFRSSYVLTGNVTGTYQWHIHAVDGRGNETITDLQSFRYVIPGSLYFSVNSCPADLQGVIMFLGMLFFFLAVLVVCMVFKLHLVGIIASLGLFVYSWFIVACYTLFGTIMAGLGIGFILYFTFHK